MPSHDQYAAFLASILQRPDDRVIDVIKQREPAPAPPADSGANPPVSSAHAGRDYTITQITSL